MPLEAGHLHPSGNQILLEVFGHLDRWTQPGMALRAVGQGLFHDPVNLRRRSPGDPRMPRLLARGLRASGQRQKRETRLLGRMQPLDETLVLLLEGLDLTLEIVDEGDELVLGQLLRIGDDVQKNLPSGSGSEPTL